MLLPSIELMKDLTPIAPEMASIITGLSYQIKRHNEGPYPGVWCDTMIYNEIT